MRTRTVAPSAGIRRIRVGLLVSAVVLVISLIAVACASSDESGRTGEGGSKEKEVVLVTYESFALPKSAAAAFRKQTGARIRVVDTGDAAEMLTKALLSAGAPEGDVIFGIDNTLVTRALNSDLLVGMDPESTALVPPEFRLTGKAADKLVAVDHGDVCMNLDPSWFADRNLTPPSSLEDLAAPAYKGLTVISSPVTSSPGLAMLIGTVAEFGTSGWEGYWRRLKANDVLVRPSWSDAYYNDYTVSGGGRPIVLSYASSPPAEVVFSEGKRTEPVSTVMGASCVSQVEYAGILRGARHPELAAKLIRFMLSPDWQVELPLSNFVYPVTDVDLPSEFRRWAPAVPDPLSLPTEQIDSNRDKWVEKWRDIME